MLRPALLAALLCAALACNGKTARTTDPSPDPPDPADDAGATSRGDPAQCDALADRVAGIYRDQLTDPIEHEVEDATEMILYDCRSNPDRFAPCIRAAATVAELERDCVVPLDPAGSVEGARFKRRGSAATR